MTVHVRFDLETDGLYFEDQLIEQQIETDLSVWLDGQMTNLVVTQKEERTDT